MPSSGRLDQLSSFLADFYSRNVCSHTRLQQAYALFATFRSKLNAKHSGRYQVHMCGSMAHGVCFNDSACDISIEPTTTTTTNDSNTMQIMRDVVDLIRDEMSDVFVSVEKDVEYLRSEAAMRGGGGCGERGRANSANRVVFKSSPNKSNNNPTSSGGIIFNFLTGVYPSAHKTGTVLRAYMDLDERARILAFCFRYLAKVNITNKKKKLDF